MSNIAGVIALVKMIADVLGPAVEAYQEIMKLIEMAEKGEEITEEMIAEARGKALSSVAKWDEGLTE
jgi:hypothetical protein